MKDYSADKINWPVKGNFVGASPVNALGYDAGWQRFKDATHDQNESGEELTSDAGSVEPSQGSE